MHPLLSSYNDRYLPFKSKGFLTLSDLDPSISLFDPDSITNRTPTPRKLEVYCIVAGLPFDSYLLSFLQHIKYLTLRTLGDCLHYLVDDSNLALELAVLKWPDAPLNHHILSETATFFESQSFSPIRFFTYGLQIHTDGCIILKCFDHDSKFTFLRSQLTHSVPHLPARQSSWAHIPIGRILEPVSPLLHSKLVDLCDNTSQFLPFPFTVDRLHLIHEKQWYQTDHTVLKTFHLN